MERLLEKYQIHVDGVVRGRATKAHMAVLLYKRAKGEYPDANVTLQQERASGLGTKQILPTLGIAMRRE